MGSAPAFMTNWCHVYVAAGLRRRGDAMPLTRESAWKRSTVPVSDVVEGMGTGSS